MRNLTETACGTTPKVNSTPLPILTTLLVLATLSVAMRFSNKYTMSGRFWWDDGFLALAWVGCVAYTAVILETTDHGLGADMWSIPFDDINHLFAVSMAPRP